MMDRIVAVIPVRIFPFSRRRVKLCSHLDDVYVATCDQEIRDIAKAFGAEVIMTSTAHERATDRVAEAV